MVPRQSLTWGPAQVFSRLALHRFARWHPRFGFRCLTFLRGGMMAPASRAAIASWHFRVSYSPSAVTLPIFCSSRIWPSNPGSMGEYPTFLLATLMARTPGVSSSNLVLVSCVRYGALGQHVHGHSTRLCPRPCPLCCRSTDWTADATSIRKAHIHRLLAATWCDAIRRGPIQPNSWKILCTWR